MSCNEKAMRRSRREAGFSFIEVMVVVVIIGLLAGAVTLQVTSYLDKAKETRVKTDMRVIEDALVAYYAEHSRYPEPGADLGKVLDLQRGNARDPWGSAYILETNVRGDEPFEIISIGADKQDGTEDDMSSLDIDRPAEDDEG